MKNFHDSFLECDSGKLSGGLIKLGRSMLLRAAELRFRLSVTF